MLLRQQERYKNIINTKIQANIMYIHFRFILKLFHLYFSYVEVKLLKVPLLQENNLSIH